MKNRYLTSMPETEPSFSIRQFLRERNALLVHFSGPTASDRNKVFPEDLMTAMDIPHEVLRFSTILPNDKGPYSDPQRPGDANACGSVGMIVDICDVGSVVTVTARDGGSLFSDAGELQSAGASPTEASCLESITDRDALGYNEWCVRNFKPVGIFVFEPIMVRQRITVCGQPETGEQEITIDHVLNAFPTARVFGNNRGSFREYDRTRGDWHAVDYNCIIAL